jgi:O-antigen/teichoic acid export membrane protein
MSNSPAEIGVWGELKSLTRHGVIYSAGGALGKAVGFFMIPFYTRFLSPADYGTLELLDLSVMLFGLVVTMWMNASVIRCYHAYANEKDKNEVISTVLLTASCLGLIAAAGGIAFGKQLSHLILKSPSFYKYFWLLSATFFFSSLNNVSFSYLRARERSKWVASIEFVAVTLTLGLNILFIAYFKMGVTGILYSSLISIGLSATTLVVATFREVNLNFSPAKLRAVAVFGLPLVLSSLAAFALNFSDRFFLQHFTTVSIVGVYALGYKLAFMLSFLIVQPFDNIWSARMYQIAKRENSGFLFSRIFRYYFLFLIAVALGISLIIKEVVALISAPAFHDAYKIVPIVLLAYVFQGTYRYVASGMYIAHKTMYVGFISGIALAANLGLNYVLIPHYKGIGAASATALSFFLMAALAYAAAQKVRPVPYNISDLVVPAAIAALIYWPSTMVSVSPLALSAALKASFFLLFPLLLYLIGYIDRDETDKMKEMASLLLHRFGWRAAPAPER